MNELAHWVETGLSPCTSWQINMDEGNYYYDKKKENYYAFKSAGDTIVLR